jgi:hypothetical protein
MSESAVNIFPPAIPEWRQQCSSPSHPSAPFDHPAAQLICRVLFPQNVFPHNYFFRYARFDQLLAHISGLAKAANRLQSGHDVGGDGGDTFEMHIVRGGSSSISPPASPTGKHGNRESSPYKPVHCSFDVMLSPVPPSSQAPTLTDGLDSASLSPVQFVAQGLSEAIGASRVHSAATMPQYLQIS